MGEMLLLKPLETSQYINDALVRPETIEDEYKLRMTRSFGDAEIRARFGENLVDRFLEMEKKRQRYKNSHHTLLPPNYLAPKLTGKFLAQQHNNQKNHPNQTYLRAQMNSSSSSASTSTRSSSNHSIRTPANHNQPQFSPSKRRVSTTAVVCDRSKTHLGGFNEDEDDDAKSLMEKSYDPNDRSKFVHSAPIIGNRVKFSSSSATKIINNQNDEKDESLLSLRKQKQQQEQQQQEQDFEQFQPPMSPISVVEEAEKIEINEMTLRTLDKTERERLYNSLADLKAKLKRIDDLEAKSIPQSAHGSSYLAGSASRRRQDHYISAASANRETNEIRNDKTITRVLKPQSAKSMSLDKWIEVHKRRSASVNGAGKRRKSKVQTQNDKLKQLNEKLKARIAQHKSSSVGLPNDETSHNDRKASRLSTPAKRFRSRRELSELTVLDRIQAQIRAELEENIKSLRKLETQNEFNSIVAKIRDFLLSSSDQDVANRELIFTTPKASSVRVYEYNLFENKI